MPKLVDRAARREELGAAVLRVLARDGVERLTLRQVAAEAGWSVGVVQHYFDDRAELVSFANQLAFERADRRIHATRDAGHPPLAKLRLVLAEGLPLDRERIEEWSAWLAFWARALTDARLGAEQAGRYRAWRGLVRGLLADAQAAGELREGLDADLEAEVLVAFVDGIGLQALFEPERLSRRALVRLLDRAIARISRDAGAPA